MGLLRALEYGLYGSLADRVAFPMTGGAGGTLGFMRGLFQPEADDLRSAASQSPLASVFERFLPPPAEGERPSPLRSILTAAATIFGASLFLGNGFGAPLYNLGPTWMGAPPSMFELGLPLPAVMPGLFRWF